jgi:acetyl-CoA carboxylase, biotin carboxylase subunit
LFDKVLIANRGEIAVRVMRTCRELGIRTVAVYSKPDITAMHTRYADEAYCIGEGEPHQSYLNIEKIIKVARECGADAIHPGYGFLSERAEFARACAEAGIIFIGPPPEAMTSLGDKVEARRIAMEAGAPTVPGTTGTVRPDEAKSVADSIGYPVLIKAAAGGGGRGIRLVSEEAALEAAVRVAATEAQAAFGDPSLYVEKYLSPVRHVEVQILGDKFGNVIHLGERECSVQRRNQKLVEESPSPAVDQFLRQRLGAAAVAIAKHAGYYNAGTVEFLLDSSGDFYFIEVNARLQVEHPVTELVTGVDLVKEQLRIAAGQPLSLRQENIQLNGWAIECRITAEDPYRNFIPGLGRIDWVSEPSGPGVRIDSCMFPGWDVPPFYDSMLSKAIAWGATREEAIQRLRRALGDYAITGLKTTIPFHIRLLENADFVAGAIDTRFLDDRFVLEPDENGAGADLALVVAAMLLHQRNGAQSGLDGAAPSPAQQSAPGSGWRLAGRMASMGQIGGGGGWRSTI